jgi:tRNA A-37 threonylcarbamoyl transferase component Bud32
MPNPELIGPRAERTSAETGVSRSDSSAIPYDLLQEASRRLGIMSLLAGALWASATVLYHLALPSMNHGGLGPLHVQTPDVISGVSAAVSLALFAYTRRTVQNPRFILDLGLAYMIFTSLALGLVSHWDHGPDGSPIRPMIGWAAVGMLMFAAIVPSSPAKILVAGLIAASMNPLTMFIGKFRGTWDFGPASNVLVMHFPDYLLAGVAVVISHVVTRLGRQVSKARDMGSYRLVRMLGKGGMGEVWQARHRMLARDAAIKLIQPDLLTRVSEKNAALVQRRFEQEAKTTASLRSPHTVQLYDFGVTETGVFYYVMELLDGIDLATLVKISGPQPPARVVHILRQVCSSLGDAHRHQMVHRDIKPTNIFLCRMGNEYDFAKVLDFGLVKAPDTGDGQLTAAGGTTGTPAYMAPELALGREKIDGRSDLYGLGCVAYWLLTGGLVFEERNATALILAHVQQTPIRPSERSGLPIADSLQDLVMRCLAKEPADRPDTAESLARALAGCEGVGQWTPEDAERWWLKNVPAGTNYSGVKGEPSILTQSMTTLNEPTVL